ncbi:MAG TPA: tetratricopeptide repeat protein [Hanamia sp.]|nr:tetratricopeptide repeat protein [Hanamia sp.]
MNLLARTSFSLMLMLTGCSISVSAQMGNSSDLIKKIANLKQKTGYLRDTAYTNAINQLAFFYADSYPDSALVLLAGQADQCRKAGYPLGETEAYKIMGNAYQTKGNFEKALDYYERANQLAETNNFKKSIPGILNNIGLVFTNQGNYPEALKKFYETLRAADAVNNKFVFGSALNNIAIVHFYQGKMDEADSAYKKTLDIAVQMNDSIRIIYAYNNIGEVNLEQKNTAGALDNFNKAYQLALLKNNPEMQVVITNNLGNTYLKEDSLQQALYQYENALRLSREKDYGLATCKALLGLANVRYRQGMLKEALINGLDGLEKAKQMGQTQLSRDANKIVADIYEKSGDGMNALKHFKMFMLFSDSLNNLANERAAANENANYQISQKELQFEKKSLQQRWITFSAFAGLLSLGVILWIIYRNKKRLNKTYKDLQQKSELIKAQKQEVEDALTKLKSTQALLIQSEKMASLGELTAGIAHEIQNPLNFVNNFSEVSNELIDEMKEELDKGDINEAKSIATDIKENLEKINHHGKRADAIVKGMLLHSRQTQGTKEPTDINALCDEYLRLSYHGLRAKDKNFNSDFKTNFDGSIGKINILPQDIGRVLLNLYNNAFYSVSEKKKTAGENYQPLVSVSTLMIKGLSGINRVEIRVEDNGNGIPEKVVDKIFQPFFTTKPPGEGTGLGLSLSYDIIKAHGGEIIVKTKYSGTAALAERKDAGTEFIVQLPLE